MANFVAGNDNNFGIFVGAGIGGNTLTGEDIWQIQNRRDIKTTDFNVAVNAGLRYNIITAIDTGHGIELVARVPFLPIKMRNENGSKITFGQTYSVLARYTYSF